MNVREIVGELPEAALSWLREGPWTAGRAAKGGSLAEVLADPARATEWAGKAPMLARDTLALIVRRFGPAPFPEEKLAPEGGKPPFGWTGAELRLAVQLLRRDGIVFAIDRPWGDRLLLVPSDMCAVWRRLLLPLRIQPLPEETWTDGCDAVASPLSHELIAAWSAIRRTGLPLTAKGAPRKQDAARLASAMRLASEDIPPQAVPAAWAALPAPAVLALRLGHAVGMLRRRGRAIAAEPNEAAKAWLALPAAEAELHLLEQAADCLLAADEPGAWQAAESLRDLAPMHWYLGADVAKAMPTPEAAKAAEGWIRFLRAAGWMETGNCAEGAALRWTIDPTPERPAAGGYEHYELMPDLEAIVPPEVPPGARWELELLARRLSEDVVAVYRIDADACRRALAGGTSLEQARAMLERGSGEPLPEAVDVALRDWFHPTPAPADVTPSDASSPLTDAERPIAGDEADDRSEEAQALDGERDEWFGEVDAAIIKRVASEAQAWDVRPPVLSSKLFPGAERVPPGWLKQPAPYHVSTRKEIVERAIGWSAGLRLMKERAWLDFAPERLMPAEPGGWCVWGRPFVREAGSGRPVLAEHPVALEAAEIGPLVILLPEAAREDASRPVT
ncbi:helicase-associated domain-containing protein [Cohnella sp. GbtcB17]|uniref:helicase-associated domain-containing protein n=1 Tax=Cohnella sp. GbtcB17 TaxID=2824762 RepID=UPI001C302800|nr:helicase-associated domain-containing protein [Cohnella sp. GbtcB17]